MIKKAFFLLIFISFLGCDDNSVDNNCFQNDLIPINLSIQSPQLNGIQTPTGFSYINGGISGIVVINSGANGYKAFDRTCPNRDCKNPLTLAYPKLKCSCDATEYSILDGSLVSGKSDCFLREYSAAVIGSTLQIRN